MTAKLLNFQNIYILLQVKSNAYLKYNKVLINLAFFSY